MQRSLWRSFWRRFGFYRTEKVRGRGTLVLDGQPAGRFDEVTLDFNLKDPDISTNITPLPHTRTPFMTGRAVFKAHTR
jgi:hypothetical protein